jgi:hypothetical protein
MQCRNSGVDILKAEDSIPPPLFLPRLRSSNYTVRGHAQKVELLSAKFETTMKYMTLRKQNEYVAEN